MQTRLVEMDKIWDNEAEHWDKMAEEPQHYYSRRSAFIAQLILENVESKGKILEGACGAGLLSLILSKNGFDVYGYDVSPKMISNTWRRLAINKVEADHFRICKGEDIPFPSMKFQAITAIDLLPYIENYDSYIKKLSDFLELDGYIVASCNNRYSLFNFAVILKHISRFGRVPEWKKTFLNLIRTAYWSGGYVDHKKARQVYDPDNFDRLFYRNGFSKVGELNLYALPYSDKNLLRRGRFSNIFARYLGWQHIGIYQKL